MTEELPQDASMTTENNEPIEETPAPAVDANVDLSTEIARTVAKQPGDKVRVTRVWGDHYRCNWVAAKPNPEATKSRIVMAGVETYHIRQSRFLKVTRLADGSLEVTDLTVDKYRTN